MSYLVSYGLGPYLNEITMREIVEGDSYFTLHFDETVTAEEKKLLDLFVHYWSEVDYEVKIKYLTSGMFGHEKTKHKMW